MQKILSFLIIFKNKAHWIAPCVAQPAGGMGQGRSDGPTVLRSSSFPTIWQGRPGDRSENQDCCSPGAPMPGALSNQDKKDNRMIPCIGFTATWRDQDRSDEPQPCRPPAPEAHPKP